MSAEGGRQRVGGRRKGDGVAAGEVWQRDDDDDDDEMGKCIGMESGDESRSIIV